MTSLERKAAIRDKAFRERRTLAEVALTECGVTWEHLSMGLASDNRPMSKDVKAKFAAYIGRTTEDVFGSSESADAA